MCMCYIQHFSLHKDATKSQLENSSQWKMARLHPKSLINRRGNVTKYEISVAILYRNNHHHFWTLNIAELPPARLLFPHLFFTHALIQSGELYLEPQDLIGTMTMLVLVKLTFQVDTACCHLPLQWWVSDSHRLGGLCCKEHGSASWTYLPKNEFCWERLKCLRSKLN